MFRKFSVPGARLDPGDSGDLYHIPAAVEGGRTEGKNCLIRLSSGSSGPPFVALITYQDEQMPEFTQGLADAGHWREKNHCADYLGFIHHICFSSTSLLFHL